MNVLNSHDINWAVRRMPKHLRATMEKDFHGKLFIAGGYLRAIVAGEPINDVDIFARNKDEAKDIVQTLRQEKQFGRWLEHPVHESDNATTIKGFPLALQVIHRWTFSDAGSVCTSFDFTCCAAALWFDGKRWCGVCDDRFYQDVAAKRLVYRKPIREEEPGGSLLRVLKYYQKGYRIPLDSFGAVIARAVAKLDWGKLENNQIELERVITGLLREVDPAVDPDHEAHLPSLDLSAESHSDSGGFVQ